MRISIVLISGIRIYREGIADQLSNGADMAVEKVFSDCRSAASQITALPVDVLIADIALTGLLDLVSHLKQKRPATRVIALSFSGGEDLVFTCARLGVEGFVSNTDSLDDLRQCVQTVHNGDFRYPSKVAQSLVRRLSQASAPRDTNPLSALTSRQSSVLELMEMGQSNKQIARSLGIQLATVKNHVHEILDKLRVSSRCEAAAVMRRHVNYL